MEIVVIIIIVAGAFYIAAKRFKGLIRGDFYLVKPDFTLQGKCKNGDDLEVVPNGKNTKIDILCRGKKIGEIPEDYQQVVLKKMRKEGDASAKLIGMNKHGYKVSIDIKGEVGDIVK
jgi:hypothetical protein